MQSVTATEVPVPQLSNEVRSVASRLSGSNEEAKVQGSESGLEALLRAWTAIFQQQILPEVQDVPTGEMSFELTDGATGGEVKGAGSKQGLPVQQDKNTAIDILGSVAGRAAIFWQKEIVPFGSASLGVDTKVETKVQPTMALAVVSADLPLAGPAELEGVLVPDSNSQKSQQIVTQVDAKGESEEIHFPVEGKIPEATKIARALTTAESGGEILTGDLLIGDRAAVDGQSEPVLPAAEVAQIEVKLQTPQALPQTPQVQLQLAQEQVVSSLAKQNAPVENLGKVLRSAVPRRSAEVVGIGDTSLQKVQVAAESKVQDSPFTKPIRFDTEVNLESEGLSRFKAALDKAAIRVQHSDPQTVEKPELEIGKVQEASASPAIAESSSPIEKNEMPIQDLKQEAPIGRVLTETLIVEQPREQGVVSQAAPEMPKRESVALPQVPDVPAKSVPVQKSEIQAPLPMTTGEAKTISIRIPLTDTSLAGTGEARHIDLVFNNRNSNLTLQFHSPSAEIQQRIEESMPTLLDKLQTADWTSKSPEVGAAPGAVEAGIEPKKRAETFLPTGMNTEAARDLSTAATSSQQGSNLDDSSANRREQQSHNSAARNRKKDQAWQTEFDEQLEP